MQGKESGVSLNDCVHEGPSLTPMSFDEVRPEKKHVRQMMVLS